MTQLLVGRDSERIRLSYDWKAHVLRKTIRSAGGRRERAALARKEMEHSLMEYWLVEAEEWKQLKQTLEPLLGRIANCSSCDLARSNNA